ncbi:MAG: hypothetical protein JJU10_05580 [Idiomarina sp.]|nr:hypothetical protein [Idiomarina sp.]
MNKKNSVNSGHETADLMSSSGQGIEIQALGVPSTFVVGPNGPGLNVSSEDMRLISNRKDYLSVLDSEKCNEHGMPLNVKLSLTNLIGDAVRRMLLETRDSWESYCIRVVQDYHERIPHSQQSIEFSASGDTLRDAMNWRKAITRYLEVDGHNRCPADVVESLIAGLSQPYQAHCRRALANRLGYVGVPLLDGDDSAACYGEFLKEAGEAIAAVSLIFRDHEIHEHDLPHIPKAIKEIAEARQQLAAMQRRLELALERKRGGPVNITAK